MEKPTFESVLEAIRVLYGSKDYGHDASSGDQSQQQASRWLDEFQRSIYAWEIANQLLYVNNDLESSYFAAQTMRRKIQSQFAEVPIEQHMPLRDSLMAHLEKLHQAPRAMVTQLCLALADLALQSPEWKNPVSDLVHRFGSHLHLLPIALELLTVLPEELNSSQVKIGANRRAQFKDHLRDTATSVLTLLVNCHTNCLSDEKIQCKIFHSFGSWLALGFFPPEDVAKSQLLKSAFDYLLSHDTPITVHEAVTDCLCSALFLSEDLERQYPLAEVCFKFVMSLSSSYEEAMKDEDFDRVLNYARLFTEMAESFLSLMINTPDEHLENIKILDFLLTCLTNPHYEVAEVTFSFWYSFADLLHKEGNERSYVVLGPHVQKLLALICSRCELESHFDGVPDASDEFHDFRLKAVEVVQDVVYVVGSASLFKELLEKIVLNQNRWHTLEAGLFIMTAIVRTIPRNEEAPLKALHLLLSLPSDVHIAVRHAAMQLAAELSYWVIDRPDLIDSLFQYILSSLHEKLLSNVTPRAFELICDTCGPKLAKHFNIVLQVTKAVESLPISAEGAIGILKGAAHVLCFLPLDEIRKGLSELCYPQLKPLSQQILHGCPNGHSLDPVQWLDRLAIIFRHTAPNVPENEEHPCLQVIEEMWPVLSSTAEKFKAEEKVMERCCRCLRFAIRCVGQGSVKLLQPLVTQMVSIYNEYQHSCFLYLGSILVDEYGSNPQCVPGLIEMLKAFCDPTFRRLSKQGGLVQHPDTVDDFFRLCIRFLQHCPREFFQNDAMDTVLLLAIAAIALDHREANASVTKFLVDTIRCSAGSRHPAQEKIARQLLSKHGLAITKGIVKACTGGIQTFMLPEVGDVLWELLVFEKQKTLQWLQEALNDLPSYGPTGTIVASQEQVGQFYLTVSSADSVKGIWRAFRDFSRLYC